LEYAGLEIEFSKKLITVAGWCRSYVDQCEPAARAEWLKFAAFLEILGSQP